tara:strand:+ start:1542 stop:1832 length:291 start_codon:yes stop_codon:yes gene_type:complete
MTILEIMERSNTRDTNLVIAWIKDAIHQIQSTQQDSISVNKQNIVSSSDGDDNQYSLPAGLISINSVSVLDTEDDNKYKNIRRLGFEPVVSEDTNP